MLLCYRFIMTVPPGKTTVGIDDAVNAGMKNKMRRTIQIHMLDFV